MRILLKILLFPVVGTWIFKAGGSVIFQNYTGTNIIILFMMAFVLTPYSLPLIAGMLIELVDTANEVIKAI